MRWFKWIIVLALTALIATASTVVVMRAKLLHYGVKQFFFKKGFSVEVGPVHLLALNHIVVDYVRMVKAQDQEHMFMLELNTLSVWASLFDFWQDGEVDKITFDSPVVRWGKIKSSLYNPFENRLLKKVWSMEDKPEGIIFHNTLGVLSIKDLAAKQIRFDLFPTDQNKEFGIISGHFTEEDQKIHGYFDFQSAQFVQENEMLAVDLNQKGKFTGGLYLVWNEDGIAMDLNPYTLKRDDFLLMGNAHLEQSRKGEDVLEGKVRFSQDKHRIAMHFKNTEHLLDLQTVIEDKRGTGKKELQCYFFPKDQKPAFHAEFHGCFDVIVNGYIEGDRVLGHLSVNLPNHPTAQADFEFVLKDGLGFLHLSRVLWDKEYRPSIKAVLEYKNRTVYIKNFEWGQRIVALKGQINLDDDSQNHVEMDLENCDLSLFVPVILPQALLEQMQTGVSGKIVVDQFPSKLVYKADLSLKNGRINDMNFRSGSVSISGEDGRMLIHPSHVVQDKNMIFFEGQLEYANGIWNKRLIYHTDGKALQWAGWMMEQKKDRNEFRMEKKISDQVSLRYRNLNDDYDREGLNQNESQLELEYQVNDSPGHLFMLMKGDDEIMGIKRKYEF